MSDMIEELHREIRFWRYMAEEFKDRQTLLEYKRITRALALAEARLEQQLVSAEDRKTRRISCWSK